MARVSSLNMSAACVTRTIGVLLYVMYANVANGCLSASAISRLLPPGWRTKSNDAGDRTTQPHANLPLVITSPWLSPAIPAPLSLSPDGATLVTAESRIDSKAEASSDRQLTYRADASWTWVPVPLLPFQPVLDRDRPQYVQVLGSADVPMPRPAFVVPYSAPARLDPPPPYPLSIEQLQALWARTLGAPARSLDNGRVPSARMSDPVVHHGWWSSVGERIVAGGESNDSSQLSANHEPVPHVNVKVSVSDNDISQHAAAAVTATAPFGAPAATAEAATVPTGAVLLTTTAPPGSPATILPAGSEVPPAASPSPPSLAHVANSNQTLVEAHQQSSTFRPKAGSEDAASAALESGSGDSENSHSGSDRPPGHNYADWAKDASTAHEFTVDNEDVIEYAFGSDNAADDNDTSESSPEILAAAKHPVGICPGCQGAPGANEQLTNSESVLSSTIDSIETAERFSFASTVENESTRTPSVYSGESAPLQGLTKPSGSDSTTQMTKTEGELIPLATEAESHHETQNPVETATSTDTPGAPPASMNSVQRQHTSAISTGKNRKQETNSTDKRARPFYEKLSEAATLSDHTLDAASSIGTDLLAGATSTQISNYSEVKKSREESSSSSQLRDVVSNESATLASYRIEESTSTTETTTLAKPAALTESSDNVELRHMHSETGAASGDEPTGVATGAAHSTSPTVVTLQNLQKFRQTYEGYEEENATRSRSTQTETRNVVPSGSARGDPFTNKEISQNSVNNEKTSATTTSVSYNDERPTTREFRTPSTTHSAFGLEVAGVSADNVRDYVNKLVQPNFPADQREVAADFAMEKHDSGLESASLETANACTSFAEGRSSNSSHGPGGCVYSTAHLNPVASASPAARSAYIEEQPSSETGTDNGVVGIESFAATVQTLPITDSLRGTPAIAGQGRLDARPDEKAEAVMPAPANGGLVKQLVVVAGVHQAEWEGSAPGDVMPSALRRGGPQTASTKGDRQPTERLSTVAAIELNQPTVHPMIVVEPHPTEAAGGGGREDGSLLDIASLVPETDTVAAIALTTPNAEQEITANDVTTRSWQRDPIEEALRNPNDEQQARPGISDAEGATTSERGNTRSRNEGGAYTAAGLRELQTAGHSSPRPVAVYATHPAFVPVQTVDSRLGDHVERVTEEAARPLVDARTGSRTLSSSTFEPREQQQLQLKQPERQQNRQLVITMRSGDNHFHGTTESGPGPVVDPLGEADKRHNGTRGAGYLGSTVHYNLTNENHHQHLGLAPVWRNNSNSVDMNNTESQSNRTGSIRSSNSDSGSNSSNRDNGSNDASDGAGRATMDAGNGSETGGAKREGSYDLGKAGRPQVRPTLDDDPERPATRNISETSYLERHGATPLTNAPHGDAEKELLGIAASSTLTAGLSTNAGGNGEHAPSLEEPVSTDSGPRGDGRLVLNERSLPLHHLAGSKLHRKPGTSSTFAGNAGGFGVARPGKSEASVEAAAGSHNIVLPGASEPPVIAVRGGFEELPPNGDTVKPVASDGVGRTQDAVSEAGRDAPFEQSSTRAKTSGGDDDALSDEDGAPFAAPGGGGGSGEGELAESDTIAAALDGGSSVLRSKKPDALLSTSEEGGSEVPADHGPAAFTDGSDNVRFEESALATIVNDNANVRTPQNVTHIVHVEERGTQPHDDAQLEHGGSSWVAKLTPLSPADRSVHVPERVVNEGDVLMVGAIPQSLVNNSADPLSRQTALHGSAIMNSVFDIIRAQSGGGASTDSRPSWTDEQPHRRPPRRVVARREG